MKIEFDTADLAPLIRQIVAEARAEQEADHARLNGRIALWEPEAAAAIGVQPHALRDLRLRGKVKASRLGRRVVYARDDLLQLLREQQTS